MSNVIDLCKRSMEIKGDTAFISCSCGTEDGWQVVVVHGGDAPVIAGIVCNGCQHELGVCWGKVSMS